MPSNRFYFLLYLFIVLLFSLFLTFCSQTNPIARITVEAGDYLRVNTPVTVPLENFPIHNTDDLVLKCIDGKNDKEVPCQLEPGNPPKLWWIISDTLKPGAERSYLLYTGKTGEWPILNTTRGEEYLSIYAGSIPVLQYHHAPVIPPEGIDSSYTRSGFIHPLWSPSGDTLTRIQPPDHYHHYGIWNPWTRVNFEGREVDFWNLGDKKGTVRFNSYISTTGGTAYGGFRVLHDHIDLTAPEGEKVALNEEWDVRVWSPFQHQAGECWLWDFTSILSCAIPEPVILEQYRYGGGIGFRAAGSWTNDNSWIVTSEGKTRKDGDATNARWCMVYGETKGGISGILFMSHPQNREHPEPMRIWPVDSKDVFFEFCPIRHKKWEILPEEKYMLTYRMLVYTGTITAEVAERYWQDFAYPPVIKIETANKIVNNTYYDDGQNEK
jgi:hypothetical protein